MYDFDDDWHRLVTFEEMLPGTSARFPAVWQWREPVRRKIAVARTASAEFLEAIADPERPEHSQHVHWSGGAYDPTAFDPIGITFDDPRQRWKEAFQDGQ